MSTDQLADAICEFAEDKKALDIVELDLRGVIDYTDYFVICSGTSDRQVKAICDGIQLGLKTSHDVRPQRVDGMMQARWVLMDYLDVIVHVFVPEVREYYGLERLWGDVPLRRPGSARPSSRVSAGAG
ncbi:MAG: ribosome silencing factor [Solirubrobacteraceae bacterium]